ncbi:MAG: GAF domain-containing sensor histidine kinase [Chloroflexi bacterium]|nr:GAF domain-containing sensor histidine kinase [Chloroflexota bacterium]
MPETDYVHYKLLYNIAREINSNLAVSSVLQAIVETTTKAVEAKGCALMLLSPDGRVLEHTVVYGLSDRYISKGPVRVDPGLIDALQGKPVAIVNVMEDPRVQYREEARREGIASMLSVPFTLGDRVIGVLRVYTADVRSFSDDDIEFLVALANLGAIALEKARICEGLDTDLKKAVEERAVLEEQKQRFLRFISIVAHDLKAPLAAIQSYFSVMLGGFSGPLTEKQKMMLERSSQRIHELLALVSDLLDISRIETGQIVQEMKNISLGEVVRKALEVVEPAAEKKGICLKVQSPPETVLIYASDVRLAQALTNLLTNAVKFTPQGGEVDIIVEDKEDELLVEVSDTGIGIPSQDMCHLFEDFFRGSNVQEKGAGLGLSIVKRIVEAHGGKICVESPCKTTGVGTRFSFTLPKRSGLQV